MFKLVPKIPRASTIVQPQYRSLPRTLMTTPSKSTPVQVHACPQPLVPPAFYQTKPPPHHLSKGFKSPWPSAGTGGFIKFFRARLFEWEEVPLPDASALPAVRTCTWLPSNLDSLKDGATRNKIIYSWLGHASCHFQIPFPVTAEGSTLPKKPVSILTDPVFELRCSPSQTIGPKRFTDPPTSIQAMASSESDNVWPELLVLSHNHYDHLSYTTLKEIFAQPNGKPRPHVFVPLGLSKWFESNMGVSQDGITELDWWEDRIAVLSDDRKVKLTLVPAQHFSGRSLFDRDQTLWAGWTFETLASEGSSQKGKKVYFAGDTGYRTVPSKASREEEDKVPTCPIFKEIGETLGPFDLSAIPIGAYLPRGFMSAIHVSEGTGAISVVSAKPLHRKMNPIDAVCAHQQVKSKKSVGIHWGSFRLTPEDVNEPPRLLKEEAKRAGLADDDFIAMGIGETQAF